MKILSAEILPLKGKYYGSTIRLKIEGQEDCDIGVWYSGKNAPSDRELKECNITRSEWDSGIFNKPREGFSGNLTTQVSDCIEFDNHTESQDCLEIMNEIVSLINNKKGA